VDGTLGTVGFSPADEARETFWNGTNCHDGIPELVELENLRTEDVAAGMPLADISGDRDDHMFPRSIGRARRRRWRR
jgi:hypothetical protein